MTDWGDYIDDVRTPTNEFPPGSLVEHVDCPDPDDKCVWRVGHKGEKIRKNHCAFHFEGVMDEI